MIIRNYILGLTFILMTITNLEAAFTLRNGKITNADELATMSAEDHFHTGMGAIEHNDWSEAARQFRIVASNFSKSLLGQEAFYYLGFAYFQLEDYDFANEAFSEYLKRHNNPQFFEEAVTYKFAIANRFKDGAKAHLFGTKQLPKWGSGRELAEEIYDEVIAAVPCHELAARSMFAKGEMLWADRYFGESVDAFQQLIRRFPKHELAPESYVAISKVYIDQAQQEMQNPDVLAFAQLNLRRFAQDFPRDDRVLKVEMNFQYVKEIYAYSLYQTGQYYERVNYLIASIMYYQNAIDLFPDTTVAQYCLGRIDSLKKCLPLKQKTPHVASTTDAPISS